MTTADLTEDVCFDFGLDFFWEEAALDFFVGEEVFEPEVPCLAFFFGGGERRPTDETSADPFDVEGEAARF